MASIFSLTSVMFSVLLRPSISTLPRRESRRWTTGRIPWSDQGILPVVQRRLSRRGSVEIDGRSNTLIITDVKENIDAIRQLVTLLDQPEPQVEIETRIVIANKSF